METLLLFMVIPRKINFTQLARYGNRCEQCYRQTFSRKFDWVQYNLNLMEKLFGKNDRKAIAIDPSYISKSGKHTPNIGYFWSGVAGAAKRGLEILGIGIIDIDIIVNQKWIAKNPLILYIEHRGTEARRNKYIEKVKTIEPDFYSVNSVLSKNKALCLCVSVFHSIFRKPILFYYKDCIMLKAGQTPNAENLQKKNYTLIDWYLHVLDGMKDRLLTISKYVVADAYFAKSTFAQGVTDLGFHLVSRLRDDANLMYIYNGKPTGKRGRPKVYGEKIDFENLDYSKMERIESSSEDEELYTLVAYSKAMKRNLNLSKNSLI